MDTLTPLRRGFPFRQMTALSLKRTLQLYFRLMQRR